MTGCLWIIAAESLIAVAAITLWRFWSNVILFLCVNHFVPSST
jgi:hypothetical protein